MKIIIIILFIALLCSCSAKKELIIIKKDNINLKKEIINLKEINNRLIDLLDECEAEKMKLK